MTWRLLRPIWRVDNITASQRLVLLALASFTDQRGANAYPSQGTLARMCCCNRSTVQRAVKALVNRHLIEVTGTGPRGTVRRKINLPMHHDVPHHAPATGCTVRPNPSNNNPSDRNPSEQDSVYFSPGPGNTKPLKYRATTGQLIDEHERRRAAGRALTAGDHRPKW